MDRGGARSRPSLILAVLAFSCCAYALLQSLVVPALPTLQRDLRASTTGVTWVFTSFLLAASVVTPIAGRLGDMFGKKRALVVVLVGLALGSLVAAIADSLPLMILGRTVQGFGGAVFPLAFGIIRDELPARRVAGAIALVSGILGIGSGLGIVLAGPILTHLDYHWLFWIPLGVASASAAAAVLVVPDSTLRAPGDVHWLGALLLSGWLVALLLALSEASTWGWLSTRTLALLLAACAIGVVWVRAELGAPHPLVDMAMMRLPGVWTTNLAALLLGFGMYGAFVLIPQFVEVPRSTGYGFGASVSEAGLFLVPTTVAMLIFSPLGGKLSGRTGSKVPLVLGSVTTLGSFLVLAVAHRSWQVAIASALLGTGIGFGFAALANLIVEAVPPDQTGVASGMNTVVRTIGGAIGAEVAASLLASHTLTGGFPSRHGYTLTFSVCAGVLVVAVAASLVVPGRHRHAQEARVVGETVPALD